MIGETLYLYNENNRVYKDDEGNSTRHTNPRFKWEAYEVVSETRNSWIIVMRGGKEIRVNKKTFEIAYIAPGYKQMAYTEEMKQAALWLEQNHADIVQAVQKCSNVQKLLAIWNILQEETED